MQREGGQRARQPVVSVGIPVYNGGAFISEAIASVLSQTLTDFELLISDNASEDDTEEICRSYQARDGRIRYFRLEENRGANLNYRFAAEMAQGDYFKWLAADDYLAPEFLEVCSDISQSRPDAVIVTTAMPYVDANRNPLPYLADQEVYLSSDGDSHLWFDAPAGLDDPRPSERFRALLMEAIHNVSTECFYGLMRRSALRSIRPHGLYVGANKVLVGELILRGRIVHLPNRLMFRRFHGTNMGSRSLEDYSQMLSSSNRAGALGARLHHATGYARAILSAPVGSRQKVASLAHLSRKIMASAS